MYKQKQKVSEAARNHELSSQQSPAVSVVSRAMAEDSGHLLNDEAVPALKLPEGDPPAPPNAPAPRSQTHRCSDAFSSCRDSFTDVMEQIQVTWQPGMAKKLTE